MQFIDTHSHIYEQEFIEDVEDVITRAKDAGVGNIFLPNCGKEDIEPIRQLCQNHPGYLYPMIGLHPENIEEDYRQVLNQMYELLLQPGHPYIAIGEVGLDYYWDRSQYELQQTVFNEQIEWANKFHLPLMIHARSAQQELVNIMKQHQHEKLSGVFHCFSGTRDEAEELLQFDNFVLGIGGVLTFKKSTLPDVLKEIPLDRIVIETDAPYLTPVPHRGKRNEPAFALHTVEKIAEVYGITPEEVAMQTNINVLHLFKRVNA